MRFKAKLSEIRNNKKPTKLEYCTVGCKRELLRILTQHCRERAGKTSSPSATMKRTIGVKARSTSILENSQGSENFVKYRSNSSLFLKHAPPAFNSTLIYGLFYDTFCQFVIHLGHITFRTCNKFHKNVPVEGQIGCTRLIFDFLP